MVIMIVCVGLDIGAFHGMVCITLGSVGSWSSWEKASNRLMDVAGITQGVHTFRLDRPGRP